MLLDSDLGLSAQERHLRPAASSSFLIYGHEYLAPMHVGILQVYHVHALPTEGRKGCQIPKHWSYRCIGACLHRPEVLDPLELDLKMAVITVWVMVIEPASSVRTASALNCWATYLSGDSSS